jgi:hypothetical protein
VYDAVSEYCGFFFSYSVARSLSREDKNDEVSEPATFGDGMSRLHLFAPEPALSPIGISISLGLGVRLFSGAVDAVLADSESNDEEA